MLFFFLVFVLFLVCIYILINFWFLFDMGFFLYLLLLFGWFFCFFCVFCLRLCFLIWVLWEGLSLRLGCLNFLFFIVLCCVFRLGWDMDIGVFLGLFFFVFGVLGEFVLLLVLGLSFDGFNLRCCWFLVWFIFFILKF